MSTITSNLQAAQQQIADAAHTAQRPPSQIQLLAVSKTFDAHAVLDAAQAGQRAFGENYLQEAIDKIALTLQLAPDLGLEWHFIGPIQSNKTRQIAQHFAWVHAVDRLKIAERLSEQRPAGFPPLNICLQINISGEASKSGATPDQALDLAQQIARLPHLRLRGLMAIPEPLPTLELQRAPYRQMKLLQDQLNEHGLQLDTLSMGMSADLAAAILEGSTIVRIGSAIFGNRNYAK
ncbi:YggS family pyridoxal phosphate-dependent enzyme [Sapientia aquatica]|uniref:Pyridoxal phosphate homeostasis protein n=1 Tax=Sapientia aquatica TaxID=1549640 RepID=A0A4R5W1A4_9BURK|nr:YggS family pyridoxal phosphate-dependent enzyme [Sapientia aquatica]TDK65842.1 YggS family pyridoxal phosphate-dependent enzyme [Sapientia aquatica]